MEALREGEKTGARMGRAGPAPQISEIAAAGGGRETDYIYIYIYIERARDR